MSYTSDIPPLNLVLLYDGDGSAVIGFQCPRCENINQLRFPGRLFDLDFFQEIECQSIKCCDRSKGQRVGYKFEFTLARGIECASMLGLNDRPLNEV
jgi:phage FluMu protein Com